MNHSLDPKDKKAMRVAYLIAGFIKQTLTPAEHEELDKWVEESDENMLLFEQMTDEQNVETGLEKMKAIDSDEPYQKIKEKLTFRPERKQRTIWPYAVAASLLIMTVSLFVFKPFEKTDPNKIGTAAIKEDLVPGSDRAVLTLANGRQIFLENQQSGDLQSEGGAKIIRVDSGGIAYQRIGDSTLRTTSYNTLTTPKGGQFRLTLTDGTKVWLNAASSLRYPVALVGPERVVELSGEAYLEVAPDKTKPFYVRSNGQEIKVLGTHFNVDAYADDPTTKTTLVEGSIQLTTARKKTVLKPGEAATVDAGGAISVNNEADVETVLAWKDGLFRFRNAGIEGIMKQVSRWYDAEIVYEGNVTHHFNGEIARRLPVSKVLELLAKTGGVQFEIKNRTITVKP